MTAPTQAEAIALLPCAHCGSADIEKWSNSYDAWIVMCSACGCSTSGDHSEVDAIAAWNRRAASIEPPFNPDWLGYRNGLADGMAEAARIEQAEPNRCNSTSLDQAGPTKLTSEQGARFAIEGAIEFGRMGINKPPEPDHWLMQFWEIGYELSNGSNSTMLERQVGDASGVAQEPAEAVYFMRQKCSKGDWVETSQDNSNDERLKIAFDFRTLYAAPQACIPQSGKCGDQDSLTIRYGMQAAVSEWISVKDRLPENGQSVVFIVNASGHFIHMNERVLGGIYRSARSFLPSYFVALGLGLSASYWMPLDAAPSPQDTKEQG